jgi:hypothetical protein
MSYNKMLEADGITLASSGPPKRLESMKKDLTLKLKCARPESLRGSFKKNGSRKTRLTMTPMSSGVASCDEVAISISKEIYCRAEP